MTMANIMNNNKKYYVAEVIGNNEVRVTANFVFLADAQDAKRRIMRSCEGKYVIKTA